MHATHYSRFGPNITGLTRVAQPHVGTAQIISNAKNVRRFRKRFKNCLCKNVDNFLYMQNDTAMEIDKNEKIHSSVRPLLLDLRLLSIVFFFGPLPLG